MLRVATDLPSWQLLLAHNGHLAFSCGYGAFPSGTEATLLRLLDSAARELLEMPGIEPD